MSCAIKVENLGKKYIIQHQQQSRYQYNSLGESLSRGIKSLGNNLLHPLQSNAKAERTEEFWALKDINFEIKQGDRVGIIGRNGAGKSTLLKILSRITHPTTGKATINGRVSSLLEVGTGFHPELTGRENIFLNGAILGMQKQEIQTKFNEIVDFAEVEKFLDTPVKHYSSGMYVRLAFAVAAHLEPEVLIVDEVLAVGDALFQRKCLGKIDEIGAQGRTVLFVSHNMQAVQQLCNRSLIISNGEKIFDGDTSIAIERYLSYDNNKLFALEQMQKCIQNLPSDSAFRMHGILLSQGGDIVFSNIENGKPLEINIDYQVFVKTTGLRVFLDLYDNQETLLIRSFNDEDNEGIPTTEPGRYSSQVTIPANLLAPTSYTLRVQATIFNIRNIYPNGIDISLDVERTGLTNRAYLCEPIRSKLAPFLHWKTVKLYALDDDTNDTKI